MRLIDFKKWLRMYGKDKIELKSHVTEEKCPFYGISPKVIMENLINPQNLINFKKASINIQEDKYKLYFRLSRQRVLAVVVEFDERLKVITIYPIVSKWQKKVRSVWKE